MHKIYFDRRQVILTDNISGIKKSKDVFIINYSGSSNLCAELEKFESENQIQTLYIFSQNLKQLKSDFDSCFTKVSAAGGLVMNKKGQYLFIKRLNKWDLPKGKKDRNEKIEETALREISEECGIDSLEITRKLNFTYHSYFFEGKRILKKTNWYLVKYNGKKAPVPEKKENITKIRWFRIGEFDVIKKNTYPSIIEVIEKYFIFQGKENK